MTDFEKELLKGFVETTHKSNESISLIFNALKSEECEHIGDEFNTKVFTIIDNYLSKFVDQNKMENIMNEILPYIESGDYDKIIRDIELYENFIFINK